jgi:hypothetical protein
MKWMQVEFGRRHVEWMQADAAVRRIARRLSVTSVWTDGRTLDGPKHHNPLRELTWVEQGTWR